MDLGSLPLWAQQLGGLLLTIATAIGLTWSERKKRKAEPAPAAETTVLAASMIDGRSMKTLVDQVSELRTEIRDSKELRHADSRAERDALDSLTRAVRENTDARHNPGLTPELAVMLARLGETK